MGRVASDASNPKQRSNAEPYGVPADHQWPLVLLTSRNPLSKKFNHSRCRRSIHPAAAASSVDANMLDNPCAHHVLIALLSVLGLVACSRVGDQALDGSAVGIGPLLPLPVQAEGLSSLLLALRRSTPHTSKNRNPVENAQHLAVSRSNSLSRAHADHHASGWLSLLVHFTAPVNSATISALAEAADGAVTASLGSGLFAVSCRREALNRVRSFPGLASLRLRSPADKRAALPRGSFHANSTHSALNPGSTGSDVHVHCHCTWPSPPCAARISSALKAHGCTVSSSPAPHHKVVGVCAAHTAAAAAEAVAGLSEVDWVEELLPFVSLDFASKQILWNQSSSVFTNTAYISALNGSGQLIAIADTGLDLSNCFFSYGQSITSANTNTRVDAGNLHTYWTIDDCSVCGQCPRSCSDFIDLEGHGTHVSGIAVGRANTALTHGAAAAAENGLAHGASLFFQDISSSSGIITPPAHLQQLFAPAYAAGARVHSNSWGCNGAKPTDCNAYSLSALEVDTFMHQHPDFLVVFAAGNAGAADGIIGTVSSPATCKNCLSVGSSNIAMADAARNWQYTSTVEMCLPRYGDDRLSLLPPCCSAVSAGAVAGSSCSLLALTCCPWDDQNICCSSEAARANQSAGKALLSPLTLSKFSSVGPTRDGRLKPDVVAPGHMIASANAGSVFSGPVGAARCEPPPAASATNVNYSARAVQLMSGTSMAAPAIAAVAAIVRQWFQEGWYPSGQPDANATMNPSSALVRAVIAASAASLKDSDDGASSLPSVKSGFGLPSLARALFIKAAGGSSRVAVVDASPLSHAGSAGLRHGGVDVVVANCSGGQVQVALAWNDLPGHPSATLQLVNDLDLLVWTHVELGSQPVLLRGNGGAVADSRNNIETVSASCVAGSNITVAVYGAIVLSPLQSYALVISGSIAQPTLTALNASRRVADAAAAGRSVQVRRRCSAAPRHVTSCAGPRPPRIPF
jgi:subtilisin family serine protease